MNYFAFFPLLTNSSNAITNPIQTSAKTPIIMVPFVQETKGKFNADIFFNFNVKLQCQKFIKYDNYQFLILNTFSKISSIKHHLVIDDCSKFTPTKTVNHNQFIFIYTASVTLRIIKIPAIALINLSFILFYL